MVYNAVPNNHGLSRHIPERIKREVRKRSKNGCVICRNLLYQYEHFSPPFKDASRHDVEGICLLCPSCHQDATAGRLDKRSVSRAYQIVQENDEIEPPFYDMRLRGDPKIQLGTSYFTNLRSGASLIRIDGDELLSFDYVEDSVFGGRRPSITGQLRDLTGQTVLEIEDNLVRFASNNVDVILEGRNLRVRTQDGRLVLWVEFQNDGTLRFDGIRMRFGDLIIEMAETFGVTFPAVDGSSPTFLLDRWEFSAPSAVIDYRSDRRDWYSGDLTIDNNGITFPGSGCRIGYGNSALNIGLIRAWAGSPFEAR
jgi:hypothetical protein